MAFANLYWGCISQQLKESELEDDQDDAGGVHIPHSHSNPVYNSVKLSLLSTVASMFESKVLYASPSNRTLTKTPRDFYMPNYEDVEITTKDKKVCRCTLLAHARKCGRGGEGEGRRDEGGGGRMPRATVSLLTPSPPQVVHGWLIKRKDAKTVCPVE